MTFYVFAVFNVDTFGKEEDFLSFFGPRIKMGNFNGKAHIDEIQDWLHIDSIIDSCEVIMKKQQTRLLLRWRKNNQRRMWPK